MNNLYIVMSYICKGKCV